MIQYVQISALCLLAAPFCAAQTEITVPGTRSFPESITSSRDGTIFIGSLGHGSVYRVPKNSTTPEEFLKPAASGLNNVLGVLADDRSNTLWVCSNNLENKGEATALKAFDLKKGELKATYPLPGAGAFCNDIAVRENGTVYVADTRLNSVVMLKKGAKEMEVAAKDDKLAGADGLDFASKDQLIVNSVSSGKLFRLDLGADGKAAYITELTPSRPLERPDGMRAIGTDKFLLAENAGRMSIVKLSGNKAEVTTIMDGKEATPAVTVARGMAWLVEGKLNYRNDAALKDKDPGAFKLFGMKMPK